MSVPGPSAVAKPVHTEALAILGRFQQIVDNEPLVRGSYISDVLAPERVGQVCGGRNACAIGGLWLAAGIQPQREVSGFFLPGTQTDRAGREDFLEDKPGLALAYTTLNDAAEFYAEQADLFLGTEYACPLEDLFEADVIDPSELTQVIAIARDRIVDMELAS